MKISKQQGGDFAPHEEGNFRAVCVDVTPPIKRDTAWGVKEEFRIVFETEAEPRDDGSPQCVWSRPFTVSLNEKSHFRKFIRQWFGRDLTAAEENEFDTETLIGRPANLVIVHETSKDGEKTYANIVACTPAKGEPLAASGKFTRKKDRQENGEKSSYRGAAQPTEKRAAAEPVDDTQAGEDWTKVKVHVGKHAGVTITDLDPAAIEKLAKNWLPVHENNPKPTADDKRLAAAIKKAQEALAEAPAAGGDF